MNDKDLKEFEKWHDRNIVNPPTLNELINRAWIGACEYKQKEIDELEESLAFRLAKSYIAGKDLSKIIQKNLTNEVEKLQAENAKMRECVEFYANEETWFEERIIGYPIALDDQGGLARKVLKQLNNTDRVINSV